MRRAIAGLAVIVALLWAVPVWAQEPTPTPTPVTPGGILIEGGAPPAFYNTDVHWYSPGVRIVTILPRSLPSRPALNVSAPTFAEVEMPGSGGGDTGLLSYPQEALDSLRASLNNSYEDAQGIVGQVRGATDGLGGLLGAPGAQSSAYSSLTGEYANARMVQTYQTMAALSGDSPTFMIQTTADPGGSFTLHQAAAQFAVSTDSLFAYIRAVGSMGPLGLNLSFIFFGLAWIFALNVIDWLAHVVKLVIKVILTLLGAVIKLFTILLNIIKALRALLPF